ncbi:hypothetical protein [uncultured Jatrophihabitans sp.]|uniref:hypothetical protein n=1 Tax=uncultured Jatrophihabitans sp. TaxID=1610747 RepID=UPI0035CABB86
MSECVIDDHPGDDEIAGGNRFLAQHERPDTIALGTHGRSLPHNPPAAGGTHRCVAVSSCTGTTVDVMVTFVLDDALGQRRDLSRHDMDSAPHVDELVEIKGQDYVVESRRWKLGRLAPSLTITVRSVMEQAV